MKVYPEIPPVEDAPPELLASGHLWIQEKVDGALLRYQVRETGRIVFGDRDQVYDREEIPLPYRHATRHVREQLDRDALRAAVEDVESVVLFGEATYHQSIDYDWDRIPPVLGIDVWDGDRGEFLDPGAVQRVFRTLGLEPVNAVEKEVRAADFDPDRFAVPDSDWYDGPAEGVVIRDKTGNRAKILHPEFRETGGTPGVEGSPEDLADRFVTHRHVERAIRDLESGGRPVTTDAVFERVLADVIREEHGRLGDLDGEFRSAVAEVVCRHLDAR